MRLFGLTGGIGSGKSTVARRFRERGLPVIDADELAREAVAKGTDGLRRIVDRFGSTVVAADGELDRKRLAAVVFEDDQARRDLNAIVHPRVAELAAERTRNLEAEGEPLACYEVPLLYENRLESALSPVVVVFTSPEVQVARTVARDSSTEDDARARVRAQMPLSTKAEKADYVIDNSGTVEKTLEQADRTFDEICRSVGVDPGRYAKSRHA
jgi:dephospho-CoA kinase